jgi:hypothetical protein
VKKLAIAFAALALFGSAAQAESKQKMVGNWMVTTQEDAFDKGGTYTSSLEVPALYSVSVVCRRPRVLGSCCPTTN